MKRLAYSLALLAAALAGAVWVLPARWIVAAIPDQVPLRVVAAQGSLWQARVWLAVGAPELQRSLPHPLRWELQWRAGPYLELSHPWLQGPLGLRPDWRGLRLAPQSLVLPASVLTTAHSLFNSLDPGGSLLLSWPALRLSPQGVYAQQGNQLLDVSWRDARSGLSRNLPLGHYRLGLYGDPAGHRMQLDSEGGILRLQGRGTRDPEHGLQFDIRVWADAQASARQKTDLSPLLHALAPDAGAPDQRRLRWPPSSP